MTRKYSLVIEGDSAGYSAYVPELPTILVTGESIEELQTFKILLHASWNIDRFRTLEGNPRHRHLGSPDREGRADGCRGHCPGPQAKRSHRIRRQGRQEGPSAVR